MLDGYNFQAQSMETLEFAQTTTNWSINSNATQWLARMQSRALLSLSSTVLLCH